MTLDDLLQAVKASNLEDWAFTGVHVVSDWTHGHFSGEYRLIPNTHSNHAVYKPDVDIAIAWGATEREDFQESWTQQYSAPGGTMVRAEILYRGTLVYRWLAVFVDGGRYLLPLPEPDGEGDYTVRRSDLDLGRLLFGLQGSGGAASSVEDAFSMGGVRIV